MAPTIQLFDRRRGAPSSALKPAIEAGASSPQPAVRRAGRAPRGLNSKSLWPAPVQPRRRPHTMAPGGGAAGAPRQRRKHPTALIKGGWTAAEDAELTRWETLCPPAPRITAAPGPLRRCARARAASAGGGSWQLRWPAPCLRPSQTAPLRSRRAPPRRLVRELGEGNWSMIARALNEAFDRDGPATGRIGKQCREVGARARARRQACAARPAASLPPDRAGAGVALRHLS